MAIRELTCISCPLGCPLKVETDENGAVLQVTGNTCKRGEIYGKKEVTAPEPHRHLHRGGGGRQRPPGERAHQDGHPQGEDFPVHGGHPRRENPGPGEHWGRGGGERLRHWRGCDRHEKQWTKNELRRRRMKFLGRLFSKRRDLKPAQPERKKPGKQRSAFPGRPEGAKPRRARFPAY